jgi:hypothetical protein
MTKEEVVAVINRLGKEMPSRMTGNEENSFLARKISPLIATHRSVVVSLLRDWLAVRIPQASRQAGAGVHEGRIWLALELAQLNSLYELKPDVESLLHAIEAGDTFLPYYAPMVEEYLEGMSSLKT